MAGMRLSMRRALGIAAALMLVAAPAAAADTVTIDRAEYFTNYAGSFVSIEARDPGADLTAHVAGGPDTPMVPLQDGGTYVEHRALVPVGGPRPDTVRVTSTDGQSATLDVSDWSVGAGTPPPAGYRQDFVTGYVDPRQAYAKIRALAAEFPDLSQVVDLPEKTNGYQRHAQAIVGTSPAYDGSTAPLAGAAAAQAVVVTSTANGQDGGNDVTVALTDPGAANAPLTVSTAGDNVVVQLATGGAGAVTSTAADVVAALNASSASALLRAETYRGNAGAEVVAPTSATQLSDYLGAPASYPRGPQTVEMLRLGAHRDGSRPGVLLYAQERGNERVTPLVTLEVAERLLRNYGTDPETTALLDNVEVFIVPSVNPDGGTYSFYDSPSHAKNMTPGCGPGQPTDPTARDDWGTDISSNFSTGSLFDGYSGGSTSCTSDVFVGPFEESEPESRDLDHVASTFPEIRFAMNIRAAGGWLTWPPGSERSSDRIPLPRPSGGVNDWFQATARTIVDHMKGFRRSVILPQRTGARIDVRDSAAGNSVDDLYYNRGILPFELSVGPDRFTGVGTAQQPVGPQPDYAAEGHAEVMESADGVMGFLGAVRAYAEDTEPPVVSVTPAPTGAPTRPLEIRFEPSEPADVHYTLDGSTPTTSSDSWSPASPRGRPTPLTIDHTTTVKWLATDVKGNSSPVSTAKFMIDSVAPTTTASVGPAATAGWRRSAVVTLDATDDLSGVAATEYSLDGGPWLAYTDPVSVTGDGQHSLAYRSRDGVGNVESPGTVAFRLDGMPPVTTAHVAPAAVGGWYRAATVTLSASDGGSGVVAQEYHLDGGPWLLYTGPVPVAGDGRHAFAYRSRDAVGNVEDAHTLTVPVDLTAPVTTAHVAPAPVGGWYRRAAVTLRVADDGSGPGTSEYSLDGTGWQRYAGAVPVTGDGRHALAYRSRDALGNVEDTRFLRIRVDTTAPAIALDVPAVARLARGERARARYECADAGSGVAGCAGPRPSGARLDTAKAGRHRFVVTASDAAGNVTRRRWSYTVLSRLPKLRVRHRGGSVLHGGPRLELTDRLPATVRISGMLQGRRDGHRVRGRLLTTHVRLAASRTRTLRIPVARGASALRGAHRRVATMRFTTTTGRLHRTMIRRIRL